MVDLYLVGFSFAAKVLMTKLLTNETVTTFPEFCVWLYANYFFFSGMKEGILTKESNVWYTIFVMLHHCCVFYKPENLKMWFFISPKLQILEAWLFQDRKTIVLEKNWRQNCLGQLWWLFVQISISGTSLTIAFFDFCLELYFLYIYEFKIIYNVLKCFI